MLNRITEISKKYKLSHLGSCYTSLGIIDEIYSIKKPDEPFVLSMGHAFLSLCVVIEKYHCIDAEKIYIKHGVHPERCDECKIYCSTGSLGNGISIACGMALADRTKNVYCLISDGESAEGIVYEVANVMRKYKLTNLKVYCNYNGFSANDIVEQWTIDNLIRIMPDIEIWHTNVEDYGLKGLSAHYVTL